jgi:hypothetical protein
MKVEGSIIGCKATPALRNMNNIQGLKSRRRNSVCFLPDVLVYQTMHINQYTKEETRNTWYDDEESTALISDCMLIITCVNGKKPLVSSTQCAFRGLEYRTPEGQRSRMRNKYRALDAILDEQDLQEVNDKNDVDEYREIYRTYSEPCHAAAHHMGLEDERLAMIIYQEDGHSLKTSKKEELSIVSHEKLSKTLQPLKFAFATPIANKTAARYSPSGRAA